MTVTDMTPEQEHEFYADPENQQVTAGRGGPRKSSVTLSAPVPVRFPVDMLDEVRAAAYAEGRSVSNWIRQAVKRQLEAES